MENFTYAISPRVYFGRGQIMNLAKNIRQYSSNVLIVTGRHSAEDNGVLNTVIEHLNKNAISYTIMNGVEPNPKIGSVKKGIEICRGNNIDGILAVGGGSALDCAKVIAGCVSYDGDPWDLISKKVKYRHVLPIFTVLTLAASGSEMNALAVISDPDRKEKLITGSPMMLPKCTIEDPCYTYTVPQYYTGAGCADIFSHLLEPYFDQDESAWISDRISEGIMKTVIKYAPVAIAKPNDYEARANLMWASSMAVNTITAKGKGVEWSVHEIEHTVSAYYDITHGAGLSAITPVWMEYVLGDKTIPKFAVYGKNVWGIDPSLPESEIAELSILKTRQFFSDLGMPNSLRAAGIENSNDFDAMAVKAFGPDGRAGSFIPLSVRDVKNILMRSL